MPVAAATLTCQPFGHLCTESWPCVWQRRTWWWATWCTSSLVIACRRTSVSSSPTRPRHVAVHNNTHAIATCGNIPQHTAALLLVILPSQRSCYTSFSRWPLYGLCVCFVCLLCVGGDLVVHGRARADRARHHHDRRGGSYSWRHTVCHT